MYKVWYRLLGQKKWIEIEGNVTADGIIDSVRMRYFLLEDGTRIEIPMQCCFKFSSERNKIIEENTKDVE